MSEPVITGESDLEETDATSTDDEPSGPARFHFDDDGRQLLASVARWLAIAAFTGWAAAAVSLAVALHHNDASGRSLGATFVVLQMVMGAVNVVISWWFLKAHRDFREAATPGSEHRALMSGLDKISRYYAVQKFLLQLTLGLIAVGLVVGLGALIVRR